MKEEAPIILRRTKHGLEALDAVDADYLAEIALGSDVEVTFRKRRSGRQHRLYWKVLGNTVKATDKWPTPAHLHDEIKFALGYVAFQNMDGREFKVFFDRAMKLIAEHCGFDPLADYERMREAA